jgi:hypothetical protein
MIRSRRRGCEPSDLAPRQRIVAVLGKEFLVLPEVFSRRYYHETVFFTEQVVRRLRAHEAYLDLGCGVGLTAVFAAFGTMYWSVPFAYRAGGTSLTALEEAIYDPRYRKNHEFIGGPRQHLEPGGQLLLGVSSTLGDVDAVNVFAAEADLHFHTDR